MMTLDEARRNAGGLVTYQPGGQRPAEWGLILRTSLSSVFVRFAGSSTPQAVRPDLLTLELAPNEQDRVVLTRTDAELVLSWAEMGQAAADEVGGYGTAEQALQDRLRAVVQP